MTTLTFFNISYVLAYLLYIKISTNHISTKTKPALLHDIDINLPWKLTIGYKLYMYT